MPSSLQPLKRIPGIHLALMLLTLLLAPTASCAATSITANVGATRINYGESMTISGNAQPVGASETLTLERSLQGGDWQPIKTVVTDAATGAWSAADEPPGSAQYRAKSADGLVFSAPTAVGVAPKVTLSVAGTPRPFVGARVQISVEPATFEGELTVSTNGPSGVESVSANASQGRATVTAPTNGVGWYTVSVASRTDVSFAAVGASTSVKVRGRHFKKGSRGPDVAALMRRLDELGFLLPGDGGRYTFAASEVTLAFQKAYDLPTNYRWGSREWKKITTLKSGPEKRYITTGTHIEVDKSRQIMLFVEENEITGIIAVSTGRTGNTPVGRFRIISRGDRPLYRYMGFIGQYGFHGYDSVPPWPASHGCVREPNWAADWTWQRTPIGTRVYIYR